MFLKYVFFLITTSLFSQSFFDTTINPIFINATTADDIYDLKFDSIQPYMYTTIPDLSNLTPIKKKEKFISMILPAVLIEKAKIKSAYDYVSNNFDNVDYSDLNKSLYEYCNCTQTTDLILCLYEQPNSIIIAQAAIESGWGTSRFFLEGFNLFGIHSYSKNTDKIKANSSLISSPVYVKKYDNISSSVSHYLRTLAKGYAYSEFRQKRIKDLPIEKLIRYLINYSERRELYVENLRTIIDYNNLTKYDTLKINWK